jgi:5-methylcytosine-specific restriction endonuclease McrA
MFQKNLNSKFAYTLKGRTYRPSLAVLRLIYSSSITKNDWGASKFTGYKALLKESHYFDQNRRCAYCRISLRADAYWDELDHIVAQTIKEEWILYPKNLVVSCKPCNSLKNADDTRSNLTSNRFPLYSNGFTVFNPHFDNWSDHFEVIKGIFLRGKPGTKGPETYKICHLYRYHIAIAYAEENGYKNKKTFRRLTHRLRDTDLNDKQIENIQLAINHIVKRKKS